MGEVNVFFKLPAPLPETETDLAGKKWHVHAFGCLPLCIRQRRRRYQNEVHENLCGSIAGHEADAEEQHNQWGAGCWNAELVKKRVGCRDGAEYT